MNLLLDPNAWSSTWGSPTTPPGSWNGTSYVVEAPEGVEMSLLLHSLDELDSTAEIRGTGLMLNGEAGAAQLTLRDYDTDDVLDGPIEFLVGVPQDFELNVPAGPARRVIVSFANSGYDGDYTITPLADAPELVANDDSAVTPFQTPVVVNVLANDTLDGVAPVAIGDVLMEISSPPASGSVVINPDGSHTYTPAPGFVGQVTYQYTIELPATCEGMFSLWCDWDFVFVGAGLGITDPPPEFDELLPFTVSGPGFSATFEYNALDENWPQVSSTGTLPAYPTYEGEPVTITQGALSFCRLLQWNCG